jgi:hypothetical protein
MPQCAFGVSGRYVGALAGTLTQSSAPRAQATLHKAISPFLTDEVYSAPRTWIPHVTLAEGLTDAALEAALDVLAPSFSSINGELNRLELVHFPPVHVEWGSNLRAASKKIGSVT